MKNYLSSFIQNSKELVAVSQIDIQTQTPTVKELLRSLLPREQRLMTTSCLLKCLNRFVQYLRSTELFEATEVTLVKDKNCSDQVQLLVSAKEKKRLHSEFAVSVQKAKVDLKTKFAILFFPTAFARTFLECSFGSVPALSVGSTFPFALPNQSTSADFAEFETGLSTGNFQWRVSRQLHSKEFSLSCDFSRKHFLEYKITQKAASFDFASSFLGFLSDKNKESVPAAGIDLTYKYKLPTKTDFDVLEEVEYNFEKIVLENKLSKVRELERTHKEEQITKKQVSSLRKELFAFKIRSHVHALDKMLELKTDFLLFGCYRHFWFDSVLFDDCFFRLHYFRNKTNKARSFANNLSAALVNKIGVKFENCTGNAFGFLKSVALVNKLHSTPEELFQKKIFAECSLVIKTKFCDWVFKLL